MLLPSLVTAFAERFLNRYDTFCLQQADGRYQRRYARVDSERVARHLLGVETLAADAVDRHGWARWLCFDADTPDGLAQLVIIADQLAAWNLQTVHEASRRGGHLWLLCDASQPAATLRLLGQGVVALLRSQGTLTTPIEVYPDVNRPPGPKGVAHPVRLPLGVHHVTGQCYPFVDVMGRPCHRNEPEAGLAWLLGQPLVTTRQLDIAVAFLQRLQAPVVAAPVPSLSRQARYGVIQWANTELSLLDAIERTHMDVALRPVGRGYIGWCPWHDDAAPQTDGRPGTPSLYVVRDKHYGWSWRCLSSNCGAHIQGKLHHTFDWLVWCSAGNVSHAVEQGRSWQQSTTERTT